ncbi:ferredoxin [Desulfatitalea tepidiphila]|uniref:ferredoxin n=1 Tax=Desulfatitalea tepidiphila TaxID=1185843 RepID=UPI0006B49CAB|nr:ferredoxin [Desulfatitalea tepidiphila]
MKRPVVDMAACTLCMGCVAVCPEVFSLNDAGYIAVADLTVYPQACVDEGAKYCPEDAISWEEE